jgi:RNA methyltransferase, TrmH family
MTIDSLTNAQVKFWVSLHQAKHRRETGSFLVEGDHLVQEAFKANALDLILLIEGRDNPYPSVKSVVLSDKVFKKVSQVESQGSIMAVCRLDLTKAVVGKRLVLCDRIQDPGNLGTIIRSATAFGFDGILCSDDCVDFTNEKVIRSTQGALFHIALTQTDLKQAILDLKKNGVTVYGTSLDQAVSLSAVKPSTPIAFVLGNEGSGVSQDVLSVCDQNIIIESTGFESLNVAVAAGILCHHFRK